MRAKFAILGGILMITSSLNAKSVWKGSAILIVKKEKLAEFERAVQKIIKPTQMEKSCIHYEGFQVLDENGQKTNRFEFHEIWTSKEAMLIEHKEKSSHMKEFFKTIKADSAETFLESFQVDGKYVAIIEGRE